MYLRVLLNVSEIFEVGHHDEKRTTTTTRSYHDTHRSTRFIAVSFYLVKSHDKENHISKPNVKDVFAYTETKKERDGERKSKI